MRSGETRAAQVAHIERNPAQHSRAMLALPVRDVMGVCPHGIERTLPCSLCHNALARQLSAKGPRA